MFKTDNDITGNEIVRKGDNVLAFSDEDKKITWKSHPEKLLSLHAWERSGFFHEDAFSIVPHLVDKSMIPKSTSKMKKGCQAIRFTEMVKSAEEA